MSKPTKPTKPRKLPLPANPAALICRIDSGSEKLEAPSFLQRAAYAITNPWKNYLLPAGYLKKLIAKSQSPLIAESRVRPGGWRSMEYIYANEEPVDAIDKQALRDNPLSIGSRNRRRIVTAKLTELIAKYRSEPQVVLLGVGAGPGRHIQAAIKESKIPLDCVEAYLIDLDDDAFDFGMTLAKQAGIARCVNFIQGDARQINEVLPQVSPHIVKLVGLVEYLSDEEIVEMLKSIHHVMADGGSLITHGLIDAYKTKRFLTRVFDLTHRHRDAAHMETLLRSAGYRPVDCTLEPSGVYPIITAVRE